MIEMMAHASTNISGLHRQVVIEVMIGALRNGFTTRRERQPAFLKNTLSQIPWGFPGASRRFMAVSSAVSTASVIVTPRSAASCRAKLVGFAISNA